MSDWSRAAEPPTPVDDGWWESVLAEEERYTAPVPPRPSRVNLERSVAPKQSRSRGAAKPVERTAKPAAWIEKPLERTERPAADWVHIRNLYRDDQVVTLTVTGFNRGGLIVEGNEGLFGFVPFSHLVDLAGSETPDRDKALSAYVGRDLQLKVIECVPEDGRVVFSERAAQVEAGRRSEIIDSLHVGQKVIGQVTNVTDFGVFVDLGGVEGLIHISELSWGRVAHPGKIVYLGQQLEVLVMDIAAERCRVALSLKRLLPNPWLSIENRYGVNQIVPATVTAVLSYGAFARLDVGVEGLIHTSEIPLEDGCTVRDFLSEGQRLDVRVLHVDAQNQRMGLSLRIDA